MKKFGALILSGVMLFSAALPAFGAEDIRVYVEGQELTFDQPPVIQNDRTLVPMRGIFEALGAEVQWDSAEKKITATWDEEVLEMYIGKYEVKKNNSPFLLTVAPQIINGRTMVPLRSVSELMKADVEWVKETREIFITKRPPKEPELPPDEVVDTEKLAEAFDNNSKVISAVFLEEIKDKPEDEISMAEYSHHGIMKLKIFKEGPGNRRVSYSKFLENIKKDNEIIKSEKFENGYGAVMYNEEYVYFIMVFKKDKYICDYTVCYIKGFEREHEALFEKFLNVYKIEIPQ